MKEILIPLNFTTTPVLYDSKQSFSASDESSGVLTFTTTANVTGTVASLTIRNASDNANRQTILVERLDINSSPFSYIIVKPLPFGNYEGEITLKKGTQIVASAVFLFGVNSSLSASVLPKLVEAYSLDALVEEVETEVSNLKDAYSVTVSETVKGVNKTESTLQAQENVRYLNEHTRKANELERISNENARIAAELARKDTFDTLVDSEVIEQTVVQEVAEKYQEIEALNAPEMVSFRQQLAEKADIADLPSSAYTFKGSTTFAALPTTENTLGDVRYVTDGTPQNYAWTGTAWTPIGNGAFANGTVTNQKLADGAVDLVKTTFKKMGKNIFNKATTLVGKYLDNNGDIMTLSGYYLSDFITVTASVNYAFQKVRAVSWYTAEKVHISQSTMYDVSSIKLAPSNASFMKIGLLAASLNLAQVEKSDSVTAYENFKYVIPTDYTEKHALVLNDIPDGSITTKKTAFAEVGKNKFDKDAITLGFYVNHTSGNLATSTSYDVSDYISVVSGASYALSGLISGAVRIAFYNTNKIFISGLYPLVNPIVIPANAVYARFSFTKGYAPTVQFENSDTPTVYESFGYKFTKEIISADTYQPEEFLAFLPSEICVAVGRTIELYNAQVAWCGNINNYHFKWDCTVGKAMKRKFSVTGVTIGTYPLTLTIYDNNMNAVFTDTSTVKVVSNVIATPKTILPIGDSLTNAKPWLGELRTLSGNQYTLVGTRGTAPLKHEGRSGFSAGSYLAATAYTFESEGVHPFWDGTRFNWAYYKTQTGITPDAVEIFLGTNGMALDPTVNANNIKQIVDYIRQDDATIPIHLVYTLYRGNQDGLGVQTSVDGYSVNTGAWKLQEDRKVFNLMVKLDELLSAYTNLYFVPVSLTHDSEFNFGATSTPVNPRASQTELLPTEATHPQTQGYYQMADVMFSVMAAH
jgi:hypothetical protein